MPRTPEVCPTAFCLLPSAFCLLLLLITHHSSLITVHAQGTTATLNGTVTDQNDAVIPDVSIAVINIAQGFQRSATTNGEGSFVVPLLPPGSYTVKAEHNGFTPTEVRDVVLNVNDQVAIKIHLNIGTVSQTVLVVDGASLISESPAVGTVVDRQFVENLPLNGRSFHSLIALTPGTVATRTNFQSQGQFSINGQRPNANYFTVDGVSANVGVGAGSDLTPGGGGSLPATSSFGGTNNLVSIDALQEFKIQASSYAPEFGRTPGGQVQIMTRSGTNEFHGTLFEYFRNDALDANDWFTNASRLTKPALRQNDFGGTLGGPVMFPRFGEGGRQPGYNGRNRTFFFFSYEGLRLRLPQTVVGRPVPTLTSRQNGPLQLRPFLNAYPVPNGRELGNGFAELNATFSDPSTLNATSIRLDHILGPKLTLFGRYNFAPSESSQRIRSLSTVQITPFKTETLTIGATSTFSTELANQLLANWSRNKVGNLNELDSFGGAIPPPESLLFPSFASKNDSFFGFSIRGVPTNPSFLLGRNVENRQRQINLVDNLSVSRGDHQLRFGFDYRRLTPVFGPQKYSLQPSFNGIAGVQTGIAFFVFISTSGSQRSPLFTNFSAYGQDTWRATRRLTLTYGLRWEVNPPPTEEASKQPAVLTGLDNPATMVLATSGTPLWKTTHNNFAPRVGVAYQLSQRQGREIVLRGGFGVFYDLGTGLAANAFSTAFPFFASRNLFGVAYPFVDPAQATPPTLSRSLPTSTRVYAFDPLLKLPYTYQWNFAAEQSLGTNQVVSVSYVAAVGRRLLRSEQFNRPNSSFQGVVVITRNTATSDYHALQVQFRRRLSRGLQALASYTWSHSIDIASSDASFSIPVAIVDPNRDRGPSDFDVRHSFTGAVTYNLPKPSRGMFANAILRDWSVDTIFTTRSATPVDAFTGTDTLGLGISTVVRPDLLVGVPIYLNDLTAPGGRRFNDTVDPSRLGCKGPFCTPAIGRQGSLGRNALRGFPVYQVDLALRRQFSLTERFRLQFRGELFNLFNHPNFADPVGDLSRADFGRSVSMLGRNLGSGAAEGGFSPLYQIGGPRSVQLGLRLVF
jgi:hypothetical protein